MRCKADTGERHTALFKGREIEPWRPMEIAAQDE
jgi:hypothetical protein